jgi:hypothetical protein
MCKEMSATDRDRKYLSLLSLLCQARFDTRGDSLADALMEQVVQRRETLTKVVGEAKVREAFRKRGAR